MHLCVPSPPFTFLPRLRSHLGVFTRPFRPLASPLTFPPPYIPYPGRVAENNPAVRRLLTGTPYRDCSTAVPSPTPLDVKSLGRKSSPPQVLPSNLFLFLAAVLVLLFIHHFPGIIGYFVHSLAFSNSRVNPLSVRRYGPGPWILFSPLSWPFSRKKSFSFFPPVSPSWWKGTH